jgi:hypothetical protein
MVYLFGEWYICEMNNIMIGSLYGVGAISPGKKGCLTKEFRKLYVPSKKSMSREQKIAIALNKCNIPKSN